MLNALSAKPHNGKNEKKDFSFYWSKKSPSIAASIFKVFADQNATIMDPFVGSGSSLYGLRLFSNRIKFIGVDLNQLPIELIHFNMNSIDAELIGQIRQSLYKFIKGNAWVYEYQLDESNEPFVLTKAFLNRESSSPYPTRLFFEKHKKKLILGKEDGELFEKAKVAYMNRSEKFAELNIKLPDLELIPNSRIAVKEGMKLSDIFSPITFNLLSKYKDLAVENLGMAVLLSSCLHLCRLTDTKSQSQFPFWVPKVDAVDRNIIELLNKKFNELTNMVEHQGLLFSQDEKPVRSNSYSDLIDCKKSTYLLINAAVQNLDENVLPDNSIDLVLTDPPYFDQVAYSEYLVIWEFFTGFQTNLEDEIVQSNRQQYSSDRKKYLQLMQEGFRVISRKLKEGHLAIVYFKDSQLKNISDFLQIMEDSNLEFLHQIHVPKSKFTYKQNTTKDGTVEGDSLYLFRKNSSIPQYPASDIPEQEISRVILSLIDDYLESFGPATASTIMDNCIIPSLWRMKLLHRIQGGNFFQKLMVESFSIDKETRKLNARK